MPINTNNPVGPIDSMAALKALLRGNTGFNGGQPSLDASDPTGYVQGTANREGRLGEMKHNLAAYGPQGVSAALPSDIQDLAGDLQSDLMTGAAAHQNIAQEEALNQQMQQYNRPDVTEQRQAGENYALKKLLMPIQMKGQYDVEAAKQRAESQAARDTSLMGGRENVANINQAGQAERTDATGAAQIRLARLKALQADKLKHPGGGLWESIFGAPKESSDRDAEITQLLSGAEPGQAATAPTQAPAAPAGWKYVPKPGGGWTAVPE